MEDIEIERYEQPKVDVYKTTGEYVGVLNNEHEFNNFRIQMLRRQVTDKYYFLWGDVKILIDECGCMDKFPAGLYDQVNNDLAEIFKINKARIITG